MASRNVDYTSAEKARLFPSTRITVAIMMCFGSIVSVSLRVNMSFAMVCMIKSNSTHGNSDMFFNTNYTREIQNKGSCGSISQENSEDNMMGEFEWSKLLQGALLGAVYYGNLITQIASGWLSDRYGGKITLALGLGIMSAINLAIPIVARFNPHVLLILRIAQGLFSAVTFPATHSIMSSWAPPLEMGLLMNIAYVGLNIFTAVLFPLSGFLCKHGFAGGWPSIFYVTGIMGVVYVIVHLFLVYDGPDSHPRISITEKRYLETTLADGHRPARNTIKVPWADLLKSGPVWSLCIAHLSGYWGLYLIVLGMPLFMKEVLKFDALQNGLYTSLPNICAMIARLGFVSVVDYTRRSSNLSITAQRKLFTGIGMFLPAICMLVITFLGCQQRYIAVGFFVGCSGSSGIALAGGYFYNHIDLSPQHSGTLMGISSAFATLPAILIPLIIGLTTGNGTKEEWRITLFISMGFFVLGGVVFLLFGSGERQQWSSKDLNDNSQKKGHDNHTFTLSDSPVSIVSYNKLSI